MLTIQLLGGFKLIYRSAILSGLTRPRGKSLLAYLLLHHATPQDRAHLAYIFWPETSDSQALTNLRRELHQLRQTLPFFDDYCYRDNQSVQWAAAADCTVDAVVFARLLQEASQAPTPTDRKTCYQRAIDLYQGDLLPGLYEDWVLAKREELRQAYIRALETLTAWLVDDHSYITATTLTQRLLQYDPLYEAGYVQLMELYALQNDRARALHTYHTCATILARELDVPPGAEIERLYQRLLHAGERSSGEQHGSTATALQLVGRRVEWQRLLQTWRQSAVGQAQAFLIEGEAGIGKTRLGEELLEWAGRQAITTARTRSYAAEGALAYAPILEWLRTPALRAAIADLDTPWRTEVARLLPELLAAEPQLPRPEPLTERWQRQRLFEALARAVTTDARPKLLLIDDLQWCDQETLEWLRFLLRFAPDAPLLLLGTVRSEEVAQDHPLHALMRELQVSKQLTTIELTPLNATETAALAAQVSDTPLDTVAADRLVQASEGNPLFIVEMAQSGDWRAPVAGAQTIVGAGQALPPKVYAVIQHRLAQLSPAARTVAALAATIGRSFTFDLLVEASHKEEEIATGLDELWRRRIMREQGINEYDFSHDRIREAAYAEISPVQRPLWHRRVAQALEVLYADDLDAVSAQVAMHYEQAGLTMQAVSYYQRAATVETRLFAHPNAITYLDLALTLLKTQPQTIERVKQELTLLLAKAYSLAVVQGFSVPDMAVLCTELEKLLPQIDDDQLRFHAHQRLRGFYGASGKTAQSHQCAKYLLEVAQRLDNPAYQLGAYQANGIVNLQLGHFTTGRYYMKQGAELYAKIGESTIRHALSDTSTVGLLGNLALTLWLLGYPDQAQTKVTEALIFAEKLEDPFQITIVHFFASMVYRYNHAVEATSAAAQHMSTLDTQYVFPLTHASVLVADGWVLAQQGQLGEGIARMRTGIDEMIAMHHTMFQTHRLAWLAEAQLRAQDWVAARATLDEAFAMSDQSGQRSADAELFRLRGKWLLQSAGATPDLAVQVAAEAAFQQALDIARSQEAKSFELRATMSLSHLWQRQGQTDQAYQALAASYGWFSEGFETHDLCTARCLLTALQPG